MNLETISIAIVLFAALGLIWLMGYLIKKSFGQQKSYDTLLDTGQCHQDRVEQSLAKTEVLQVRQEKLIDKVEQQVARIDALLDHFEHDMKR